MDIVGINYYWTNQWEYSHTGIPLADDDARVWPLRDIVESVWRRYGGEVCITETAHVGENRERWMCAVIEECETLLDAAVPLMGVCLYPILGMPEWHEQDRWTQMGLWDVHEQNGRLVRALHEPLYRALKKGQERIEPLRLTRLEEDGTAYVA